jgi:hypothetical protein
MFGGGHSQYIYSPNQQMWIEYPQLDFAPICKALKVTNSGLGSKCIEENARFASMCRLSTFSSLINLTSVNYRPIARKHPQTGNAPKFSAA